MLASVEILAGVIRSGPNHHQYGDPYEFAVAFSVVDNKTAIIKGLVIHPDANNKLTRDHIKAMYQALAKLGLTADWERKKLLPESATSQEDIA